MPLKRFLHTISLQFGNHDDGTLKSMGESPAPCSISTALGGTTSDTERCHVPFRSFSSLKLDKDDESEDAFILDWSDSAKMDDNDRPHGFSTLMNANLTPATGRRYASDAAGSFGSHIPITPNKVPTTGKTEQQMGLGESSGCTRKYYSMDFTPTSGQTPYGMDASPFTISSAFCPKRYNSPVNDSPMIFKRRKTTDTGNKMTQCRDEKRVKDSGSGKPRVPLQLLTSLTNVAISTTPARTSMPRCHSESQVAIMKAVSQSAQDQTLIGDFSKPYLLPLISGGRHPDLKAISTGTVARVLCGEFNNWLTSFTIVDCRYPYEFKGGHIKTATNWPQQEMVVEFLSQKKGAPLSPNESAPRNILVFYCEFSAERAPKALRQLRERDRMTNRDYYPALHFPEMYLLEGGYKTFYEQHPELCVPPSYTRMLDPRHLEDLKHFRAKSRSWAADNRLAKHGRNDNIPRTGIRRFARQCLSNND